jgi:hypothetical protein
MGGYLSIRVDRDELEILSVPDGLTVVEAPRQPTFEEGQ